MPASTAPLKLAAVACVLLFIGLGVYLAPLQPSVVALQLTFTPEAFTQVLHAWGPEGVQRFRNHLAFDGLMLLSYGAAGYLAVARTRFFEPLAQQMPLRWVALLLPLAAVWDAGENVLHWGLTGGDVLTLPCAFVLYYIAGLCATLKWAAILSFGIASLMAYAQ
ncbi:hypothetical protein [Rhodoferax sp.]|uniref:hypothetical protein n=1 Tax=Rhodoferax sp. TaxID=50421 RepID=UPI002ACD35F9|nr:hypothetical protein [Rhodoferax sp.]MDZ7919218.1 hypothetical protein [Rhodoferax sp.]